MRRSRFNVGEGPAADVRVFGAKAMASVEANAVTSYVRFWGKISQRWGWLDACS